MMERHLKYLIATVAFTCIIHSGSAVICTKESLWGQTVSMRCPQLTDSPDEQYCCGSKEDRFCCNTPFLINDKTIIELTDNKYPADTLIAVDFEVFGIVQGVFFRKYTQSKASELDIQGWCKNTEQGTVIGHLEGSLKSVSIMKEWLQKTGSPRSCIDKVEFKNEREISILNHKSFSVRY